MKHKLISMLSALAAVILTFFGNIFAGPPRQAGGVFLGRSRTTDVAFTYRMGAGFPGDVNRTQPFSALPFLINTTNPPLAYGNPLIVNAADNTLRGVIAADGSATAAKIYGVLIRPYPTQQTSGGMSASIGAAVPPVSGIADALRSGFIMCKLPAGQVVSKGGAVFVWAAPTSGSSIQGGLVNAASTTNTLTVINAAFTGPADANGNVEVEVWPN